VNIRLDLLAWTAAAAMAAIPATALAAVDTFIWFEGGQGTSTDARHKGWFEVRDFSFAVEGPAAEFTIKRVSDSASPTFFRQAVSSGRHFPVVKIEMRKAGGDPHQYADYVFTDVLISKINMSGPGDRGPEESITFVYGGMTVQYVNQGASGQTAPAPAKALAPPPPGRSQPPPR
jgi:type VI secretion system secreted protein Hcp